MDFSSIKKIVGVFNSRDQVDEHDRRVNHEIGDVEVQHWREEIVSYVNNEFTRRQQERIPFELQWRLNMNFLNNHQYCNINIYAQKIEEQEKMWYWQEREVFNHIAPITETRLAKLSRVKPAMTVLPATSNLDDVNATKVCKSILKAAYKKLNIESKIDTANAWAEVCSAVFYKITWNPSGGRLIGYRVDPEDVGPVGGGSGTKYPVYEGEVEVSVVPSYEIYPDSQFNDGPEMCRSIIHARAYSAADVKEIWNVTVTGTDVDVYSLGMSNIALGGLGYNATIPLIAPTVKHDAVIVKEYQEKPSKQYPNGRLIIVAEDKLLYYGDLPYKNGEDGKRSFSIVRQVCVDRPGCFWGNTIIERLIPVQRSYNAVKNRKHEFLNRCAIGVWSYEDGSLSNEEELEEDGFAPGTMLPRRPGSAPPTQVNNGNLPPEFAQEEQELKEQFIDISGVSELSRNSSAPANVGSGTALEILKEQDDTRLMLSANSIKKAIIEVDKHLLRLYKQFAIGPRMDRLMGENNEVMVEMWNASNITTDDVVPESEDNLNQTPAQKKQMLLNVMQMGLINDPETGKLSRRMRSKVLEVMDMGNWESIDDIEQRHISRAIKENIEIGKGQPIKVRDYDDHNIHIVEHDRYRLSDDFEVLEQDRPDLAFVFNAHVDLHKQMLAQQEIAAMQQQIAFQQGMLGVKQQQGPPAEGQNEPEIPQQK